MDSNINYRNFKIANVEFGNSDDKYPYQIIFKSNTGKFTMAAEADCCSQSWFEIIDEDLDSIIGKTIESIDTMDDLELPMRKPSNVQEYDQYSKVTITFVDGTTYNILMINSSNGYYSGWISCY